MEEKPAGSSATAGANSPASAEPASSRRRAGGHKRKANSLSNSLSSSTPPKRLTREKAAISNLSIHNGPLTRARQSPSISASSAGVKVEEKVVAAEVPETSAAVVEEEVSKVDELGAAIEVEFEVIRSRDSNAHVVPSHCGWFSWTKIHPVEERTLPSFFNGKAQGRTPDTYLEIRNWIIKKFHANPNREIELKDLPELEVSEMDAKQEVLEFLDYWGLINFHPLQIDSVANTDDDGAAKRDSMLEKLFRFEAVKPCPPVVLKPNPTATAMPSGLCPESAFAEELAKLEGPNVEYHCNSCSADCSRKRYHCQKQADYDLCADCFNNGNFGSNMSSSDFILMEPAEAPGVSGGKWTDQETLLLLEALELYKENWNEIAEHVATKTKAQCILHFVQMPIGDAFFDCADDMDVSSKETANADATIDATSGPKDVPETGEGKTGAKEDQPLTSPTEDSKSENTSEVKVCQETTKPEKTSEVINGQETSKSEDASEVKSGEETREYLALKALTEAFEAAGYSPTSENQLSFAEVGNPVMTLALFLASLVGPDLAIASAQSSLKALSSNSPGMQLAARHCFLLEDPPDEKKESSGSDCVATEMADQDAQKDNQEEKIQEGNNPTTGFDNGDLSNDHSDKKKVEHSVPEEKKPLDTSRGESPEKGNAANEAEIAVTTEEVEHGKSKESSNSESLRDHPASMVKESDEMPSKSECPPSSVEEPPEGFSAEEHSQLTEVAEDVDMVSDLKPPEKNEPSKSVTSMSVDEPSQVGEGSKDVDIVPDSLPADIVPDSLPADNNEHQEPAKSNAGEHSQPAEATKNIDMLFSQPAAVDKPQQPNVPDQKVENGAATDEDPRDMKKEKPDCEVIKDGNNFDKLKRAAVSTLSAAAVKAKFLANQEEDQIRQLAASLIEKQLHKMEMKLAFFNEMDGVIMRVREHLDRSRQKLYQERAQIIANRLGLPAASSRTMPPSLPANRIAMNFANAFPRPPMGMISQKPPVSRPMGTLAPSASGPLVSTTSTAGNSIRPSGQDKLSSVETN